MLRAFFILFMLVFSLVSEKSFAVEVNDLYKSSVVVNSQANEQRQRATQSALANVFLKVGGKKSVLTNGVLRKALKSPNRYVSQYHYQRKDSQLSLVVSFNENMVNSLFKSAKLALWGSLRPQVLLWLIDEKGLTRSIISSDTDNDIPSSVSNFSVKRGLPIIMPKVELTDSSQALLNPIWRYFPKEIEQASLPYGADTIVVMRISDSSLLAEIDNNFASTENLGQSRDNVDEISCGLLCQHEQEVIAQPKVLDWRVQTQGALYAQSYQGLDKLALINNALSDITELIYQSYALLTSAENDFVIEVKNVNSLKSDHQLYTFLRGLSSVNNVTLINAKGDSRQFKLDLLGSKTSFLAALKLDDKLTPFVEPVLLQPSVLDGLESPQIIFESDFKTETETEIAPEYEMDLENDFEQQQGYQGEIIILGENQAATQALIDKNNEEDFNSKEEGLNRKIVYNESIYDGKNSVSEVDNNIVVEEGIRPSKPVNSASVVLGRKANGLTKPSIPVFIWEKG
jgi:hypothetical protein